jgi:hypothetical protein
METKKPLFLAVFNFGTSHNSPYFVWRFWRSVHKFTLANKKFLIVVNFSAGFQP